MCTQSFPPLSCSMMDIKGLFCRICEDMTNVTIQMTEEHNNRSLSWDLLIYFYNDKEESDKCNNDIVYLGFLYIGDLSRLFLGIRWRDIRWIQSWHNVNVKLLYWELWREIASYCNRDDQYRGSVFLSIIKAFIHKCFWIIQNPPIVRFAPISPNSTVWTCLEHPPLLIALSPLNIFHFTGDFSVMFDAQHSVAYSSISKMI